MSVELNNERLKRKFIKGNKRAFDKIYADYSDAMYTICLRYTKNSDKAADILQDAFIKIYQKRELFDPSYELGGWIKRIVINEAINAYRQSKKFEFVEDDSYFEAEDESFMIDLDEGIDIKKVLQEVLDEMPEGYRTIFNMYVFENLKHFEIADYLNISENTSKTQLAKARRLIKSKLKERNITRSTVTNG